MNLGSPQFERQLRDRIRFETSSRRRITLMQSLYYLFRDNFAFNPWLLMTLSLVVMNRDGPTPDDFWRSLAWVSLVTIFAQAALLKRSLERGDELKAFEIMPIDSPTVFRWFQLTERRLSVPSASAFFLIFASFAAIYEAPSWAFAVCPVAAFALWIFQQSFSTALLVAGVRPTMSLALAGVCYFLWMGGILTPDSTDHQFIHWWHDANKFADDLPGIWPIRSFAAFLPVASPSDHRYIGPTVIAIIALPLLSRIAAARYRLPLATSESHRKQKEGPIVQWIRGEGTLRAILRSNPETTVIAETNDRSDEDRARLALAKELFLQHSGRNGNGLAGRIVRHCLSEREREVINFLFPTIAAILVSRTIIILASLFTAAALFGLAFNSSALSVAFANLVLQFYFIGARPLDRPPGVQLTKAYGQVTPAHIYYPAMTFRECSFVMMKTILIDWAIFAPLLAAFWAISISISGQWGGDELPISSPLSLFIGMAMIFYVGVVAAPRRSVRFFQPSYPPLLDLLFVAAFVGSAMYAILRVEGALHSLAWMLALFVVSFGEWRLHDRVNERHPVDLVVNSSRFPRFLKRRPP